MTSKKSGFSRRNFLKSMGTAGLGAFVSSAAQPLDARAATAESQQKVPTRDFGKTGEKVSILALGGNGSSLSLVMMNQAIKLGVTFWDAWDSDRPYGGGISQKSIGKYFEKFPDDRKKIFLMTKSSDREPKTLTAFLDKALAVMRTDTIDFFVLHSRSSVKSMTAEVRTWVNAAKAAGKIRYVGISSHSRMESVMHGAVELGWIDGVMVTYNYRVMNNESMIKAVESCSRAGLAIVAMKTQAKSVWPMAFPENETEINLADAFIQKGYTPAQANLKAVWTNPAICSLTSMMTSMNRFSANAAAALDKTELSSRELGLLKQYASETRSSYCAGCTQICQAALGRKVPIGDVMRCLMYANSYGDQKYGQMLYNNLPEKTRREMADLDCTAAERRCPQHIAIGDVLKGAAEKFA